MSKADQIFLANCQEILSRGTWDTHLPVRPRWGTTHPRPYGQMFRPGQPL